MAVVNIVVTGIGLGSTMPLYMIAIQNAVPREILGVATSSSAFFRSIGGSVGLAVFGSAMNNRFYSEFFRRLPDKLREILPMDQLEALVRNPQALVSTESQTQLSNLFSEAGPDSAAYLEQLLQTLREALSSALSYVFVIGFLIVILAFLINFFIKEIPLRRHH
jgi:predicted PurR-regulated permease PerM